MMSNKKEELADCYRLAHKYGLSDLVFGHISVREDNGYYIKEQLMPFELVTPYNLKYIELDQDTKSMNDFGIHKHIYNEFPEASAVMHVHSKEICAMACSNERLLNISQPSSLVNTSFGEYEYEGSLMFDKEYKKLLALMKDHEFILMRNHGFITMGKSLQHVFFNSYIFNQACQIQMLARNHTEMPTEVLQNIREMKLLLKYHQQKRELWNNLVKGL